MSASKKNSREETESSINIKAWKDPAFKKKLLAEPKKALEEFGLKNIPPKVQIKVIAEKENEWCLVVRQAPPQAKNMSDEELKSLSAAGSCMTTQ